MNVGKCRSSNVHQLFSSLLPDLLHWLVHIPGSCGVLVGWRSGGYYEFVPQIGREIINSLPENAGESITHNITTNRWHGHMKGKVHPHRQCKKLPTAVLQTAWRRSRTSPGKPPLPLAVSAVSAYTRWQEPLTTPLHYL